MSGFDPSAFVQAEQQSLPLSPPVAKPEPASATVGNAMEMAETLGVEPHGWDSVATVAAVAGIVEDLAPELPHAADLNRMFRFRCPPGFKPSVWFRLCKSIRAFVADGKASEAMACGWETIELFGYPARPWEFNRAPIYMTGVVFALRGLRAGVVRADWIEIILPRDRVNWRCYKAHHMTGRANSLPCWIALDPTRWPHEEDHIV